MNKKLFNFNHYVEYLYCTDNITTWTHTANNIKSLRVAAHSNAHRP